jgi:hypothetical protein
MKMFAASRTSSVIQNDRIRNGFGAVGTGLLAPLDGVGVRVAIA